MSAYYRRPQVIDRIVEYLGGRRLEEATCVYVARSDLPTYNRLEVRPPQQLAYFLGKGLDVGRSLWDRRRLLAHLDIEYLNHDSAAEVYRDPVRSFALQEPAAATAVRLLAGYGIRALHLLTGRGHHLVWQVEQGSPTFERIRRLGRVPASLRRYDEMPHPPVRAAVPPPLSAAHAGMGLLMEYLAARIKREAGPLGSLPVEMSDVAAPRTGRGRELVLLDISEYHDPLHTRTVRVPFTMYRKPWAKGVAGDLASTGQLQTVVAIPRLEMELPELLALRADLPAVAGLAGQVSVEIPLEEEATGRLIDDYEGSGLRRFHDWFYAEEPHPPERWSRTYDQMLAGDLPDALPLCVRRILESPLDRLRDRAALRLVVRALLALGWHPRHIAGMIRSRYERGPGWGESWREYDPGLRADFYTRLYTGLFVTGLDDLSDFTCGALEEQGLCGEAPCPLTEEIRRSLIERRDHERLGSGPFNGLFLPQQHP